MLDAREAKFHNRRLTTTARIFWPSVISPEICNVKRNLQFLTRRFVYYSADIVLENAPLHKHRQGTKELKFSSPVQYKEGKPAAWSLALTPLWSHIPQHCRVICVIWSHRTRLSTKTSLIDVNCFILISRYPAINTKVCKMSHYSPSEKIILIVWLNFM